MAVVSPLKLILLSAVCTLAENTFFSWNQFKALDGEKETKIVFDIKLETLPWQRYGRTFNITYPTGYYIAKQEMNAKVETHYKLMSEWGYITETVSICDHSFHQKYLQPFGVNSNFSSESGCPIKPHTYYFKEVNNLDELSAPSDLPSDDYFITVKYFEDDYVIGGFSGHLLCLNRS